MNASFRLPSHPPPPTPPAARAVFVKTNWQDPYLHKSGTKESGLPVDDWRATQHRRVRDRGSQNTLIRSSRAPCPPAHPLPAGRPGPLQPTQAR